MERPLVSPHKKLKTVPSGKKVMPRVFWNHHYFRLVDFHMRGVTVNVTSYCATLDGLGNAFRRKRPELLPKGVLVLHVNALTHRPRVTRDLKQIFL
ncbi:hypothetical protein AVEN_64961-1 [Araneus ventricosus]|uniref:Uncharacterized protein n=1 Tax=Araneus ventricosus TaxID=182803 RepID=A0A4Y2JT42_ARAVE|nr:hypothetical protein AVEN_64961-1 [Araneus ventricosus]